MVGIVAFTSHWVITDSRCIVQFLSAQNVLVRYPRPRFDGIFVDWCYPTVWVVCTPYSLVTCDVNFSLAVSLHVPCCVHRENSQYLGPVITRAISAASEIVILVITYKKTSYILKENPLFRSQNRLTFVVIRNGGFWAVLCTRLLVLNLALEAVYRLCTYRYHLQCCQTDRYYTFLRILLALNLITITLDILSAIIYVSDTSTNYLVHLRLTCIYSMPTSTPHTSATSSRCGFTCNTKQLMLDGLTSPVVEWPLFYFHILS